MTATTSNNGINTIPQETTEAQLGAFLKEHKEIEMIVPVVIGVLATSRFQLRGAKALLVNLLVASVTRQVFAKLKEVGGEPANSPQFSSQESSSDRDCTLIHFVPGRIRLRVPRVRHDRSFALQLEQRLNAEETVTSVRINQDAACVAIAYTSPEKSDLAMSTYLVTIIQQKESEEEKE